MAGGTSNPINVPGESFSARKNPKFSKVEGVILDSNGKQIEVKPPEISNGNYSDALGVSNSFPAFVFEKISTPEYGVRNDAIARFTGVPVNRPDFLNDYHFISLMRMVDKITAPKYNGKVVAIYNTPGSKS